MTTSVSVSRIMFDHPKGNICESIPSSYHAPKKNISTFLNICIYYTINNYVQIHPYGQSASKNGITFDLIEDSPI